MRDKISHGRVASRLVTIFPFRESTFDARCKLFFDESLSHPILIRLGSLFGYPVEQEGILQAERQLEDHVHVLGAQQLETWTVEVRYGWSCFGMLQSFFDLLHLV